MIDVSTIRSLELVQNIRNSKSKDSLYGFLNHTATPMGARLLRNNILQPPTLKDEVILPRFVALHEMTLKEPMFFEIRKCKAKQHF
jgi:DNA mismatch repair protein MSH4